MSANKSRWKQNIKEEVDTLVANNLEFKEVVKYVADATKKMFFERI